MQLAILGKITAQDDDDKNFDSDFMRYLVHYGTKGVHKSSSKLDFSSHELGMLVDNIHKYHNDCRTNLSLWTQYKDIKLHNNALAFVNQGGRKPVRFGQRAIPEV